MGIKLMFTNHHDVYEFLRSIEITPVPEKGITVFARTLQLPDQGETVVHTPYDPRYFSFQMVIHPFGWPTLRKAMHELSKNDSAMKKRMQHLDDILTAHWNGWVGWTKSRPPLTQDEVNFHMIESISPELDWSAPLDKATRRAIRTPRVVKDWILKHEGYAVTPYPNSDELFCIGGEVDLTKSLRAAAHLFGIELNEATIKQTKETMAFRYEVRWHDTPEAVNRVYRKCPITSCMTKFGLYHHAVPDDVTPASALANELTGNIKLVSIHKGDQIVGRTWVVRRDEGHRDTYEWDAVKVYSSLSPEVAANILKRHGIRPSLTTSSRETRYRMIFKPIIYKNYCLWPYVDFGGNTEVEIWEGNGEVRITFDVENPILEAEGYTRLGTAYTEHEAGVLISGPYTPVFDYGRRGVWSDFHDAYIDEDTAEQLLYPDGTQDWCDPGSYDVVWSEYYDRYVILEDAVQCWHTDYVYRDDAVKVLTRRGLEYVIEDYFDDADLVEVESDEHSTIWAEKCITTECENCGEYHLDEDEHIVNIDGENICHNCYEPEGEMVARTGLLSGETPKTTRIELIQYDGELYGREEGTDYFIPLKEIQEEYAEC